MSPFLDHDDFQKSRRALMISAAFLLLLSKVELSGHAFSVFGVMFVFKREVVGGFLSAFMIYFCYVFVIRSANYYVTEKIQEIEDYYKVRLGEIEKMGASQFAERFKRPSGELNFISRVLKLVILYGVDLLPPLALAVWAAKSADSYGLILSFIHA